MSKRPAKTTGPKPRIEKSPPPKADPPLPPPRPFKPRPKLFAFLLIAFAIWLGILLTLYFKTVYPMRYPASAPPASSHL